MRNLFFILLLTIIISGCRDLKIVQTTTDSYDLIGNVVFFSERSTKIKLDKDWKYSIDTIDSYDIISNKFFNNKGVLDSIYYFDKDSLFLSKILYNCNFWNNKIISVQYDKHGDITNETKFVSFKDSIELRADYNVKTEEIISKTWTKKVNFKTIWVKSENMQKKLYSEWIYERDINGMMIGIKMKIDPQKYHDYQIIKIKYLEYDIKGNWTKRIEYSDNDHENYCLLKKRTIKYNN
jgi:hypothetical protein